jgi:hypothetical protein
MAMAVHGIWNEEKKQFVSPAEAWGYRFEHTMDNLVAFDPKGLAEWVEENSWDGLDMDRFVAENVELDYETGQFYLDPEADPTGGDYEKKGVEIEDLWVSAEDSMWTEDDSMSVLHNEILKRITNDGRSFEWGDEEVDGWSWTSGDLTPAELGVARAVRVFVNGIDDGGYLYQA